MCVAADFNAYVSKNGNDSMIMVALADIPAGKEVSKLPSGC